MRFSTTASEVEWELWYQDLFDRESPRQVEMRGRGLAEGLRELWARHLLETVQADGVRGFSRFNLWLRQEHISVEIVGDWGGQRRLRNWVYGQPRGSTSLELDEGGVALLDLIAETHQDQILIGASSQKILSLAKNAQSQDEFKKWLFST